MPLAERKHAQTVFLLRQHVVLVMVLAPVEAWDRDVHARVVDCREKSCRQCKHRDASGVQPYRARYDNDREQVDVLPNKVLERVLIDRIFDAVGGDMLLVMVLVHPRVSERVRACAAEFLTSSRGVRGTADEYAHSPMMQSAMKERVEEVVDNEQQWRRDGRVEHRYLARGPPDLLLRCPHVPQRVVEKHRDVHLVEPALERATMRQGPGEARR